MSKKFSFFSKLFSTEAIRYAPKTKNFRDIHCVIKKAELEDIRGMLAIERDVYNGKVPWTRSVFELELRNKLPHLYLVVMHQEEVIAFIGCRVKNFDAHITNFAVKKEFQGQGIGKFLVEEEKRFATQQKAYQMSLEVHFENKEAQALYRRCGFISQNIMKNYYDWQEDGLIMTYSLKDY